MKISGFALVGLVVLGLAACGDDNDNSNVLTLSVDGAPVSLAAGETRTVTVNIRRPEGTATAELTTSGAPSDVTVTVDPQTATDTATLTIATAATTAPASFSIRLLALAGSRGASADIPVTVGTAPALATVTGRPVDAGGSILRPDSVSVWSAGATEPVAAVIATDGTFTATNVTPPYDVRMDYEGGFAHVLYIGLRTATPNLLLGVESFNSPNSGVGVFGTFGDAAEPPTGSGTFVYGSCPGNVSDVTFASSSSYSLGLRGTLTANTACTAGALRGTFDPESGNPTAWLSKQSVPFTAVPESDVNVSFALTGAAPLASHSVDWQVSSTVGVQNDSELMWLPAPGVAVQSPEELSRSAPFVVPNGERFAVVTDGTDWSVGGGWLTSSVIEDTTTTVRVVKPPFIGFEPIFDGTLPADIRFNSYSEAPASMLLNIRNEDAFWLVGTDHSVDSAKLASRGLTFVDNAIYAADAYVFFSQPTIDDLTRPAGFVEMYGAPLSVRMIELPEFRTTTADVPL